MDPVIVGRTRFAIVATDSFCGNNIDDNTKATPALCDVTPIALPNVLTYTIGWLSDLVGWHLSLNSSITPCSTSGVVHGMYDMGGSPAVALFADDSNTIGVITVHQGIPANATDAHRCGRAVSHPQSIMMDSWLPLH